MSDSYSVKAVLSAQDKNFSSVFKKAGGFADSFADKLTSGLGFGVLTGIGQKAFNVISGAASGAISSIVDTGKSFESATSQIAATMGKPKKEIQNLIDKAAELGRTTKFTATEAAEGLNILAMSGLSAEQQLVAIDDVLNLAAAGAENMDAAAQQVVGTMKGFSMEIDGATNGVKNARYVSDLLAKGASLAATDVNMLGTALSDASATSASYGQSADRTAVALLRLAEQNVTGAEAATALNRAMMDLYTPTSTAAKTLKRLGVSAYDSSGKAKDFNVVVDELSASLSGMSEEEQNAAKNAIFSTYGLQAFNKMVVSSSDKVKEFEDGLASASDGIGAAAEMAAEQMNNLEGDMTLMSSSMDGLRNSIYEKFNAPMRAATKLATSGIEAITQKIEKMGDSLSKLIDLDALKKALDEGGFSAGLSELLKGLDKIPEGFRAAGAAAAAGLGAMVLGGPLQNLPGIFNGATVAANVFGHKLQALPQNAVKGFQNLKTAAGNVATRIGNAGAKISNMLPAKLGSKIGAVTGKFSGLGNVIKSKVVPADSLMSKIWQKMPNVMAPVGRAAEGAGKTLQKVSGVGLKAMTGMVNGITSVIGIGLQAIAPAVLIGAALAGLGVLYNKFGSQIDSFVETAVTKGPEVISGFVSGITSRLPELMNAGSQMLTGFLRVITANIPAIASGAMLLVSTLAQGVMDNIPQLLPAVVSLVGTFASTVIDMAPKLIILGLQLVLSLVNGIVGNIGQIVETAVSLIGQFSNTFASNLPTIVSLGIEILMKLAAGIIQALPAIIVAGIQGISVLINSISSQLPRILQAGVTIIGMLISGIVNNLPAIMQAAVGAIQALISGIAQNLPAIISAGFTIIGQLVVGIVQMLPSIVTSGWEIIKSLATGIIDAIPNVLTGVIDGIKGVFSNLWDFVTGKSSASTAEITASVTEMSGSWQSSTADMAAASTMNFDALGTNVGAAMQTANATVSAEAETMKANVSGYQVSSSNTTAPSSWSDTMVNTTATNKYLWNYETITYTDGTTEDSTKRVIGTHGEKGDTGASIASVTNYYLASASSSGVTTSTSGWTTNPTASAATMTSTKQYLWNYEVIKDSNNTTITTTSPVIIGRYGQNGGTGSAGKGITGITEYYLATSASSGVTTSTSGWTTAVQSTTATNKYLWNYEVISYTSGNPYTSDPRIIGTYGDKGDKGDKGDTGDRGATWYAGTGITGTSTTAKVFSGSGVSSAIVGDHYLNTSTQNVYRCTVAGAASTAKWVYEQNIKGEQGIQGIQGNKGDPGDTYYFHIKYSNDGGATFTGNSGEDTGSYIGTYADTVEADSIDVGDYDWVKIEGTDGRNGADHNLLMDVYASSLTKVDGPANRYLSDASNSTTTGQFIAEANLPDPNATHFYRISATQAGKSRGLCWYTGANPPIISGSTYRIGCYARASSGSPKMNLRFSANNANQKFFTVSNADWQWFEYTAIFEDSGSTADTYKRTYFYCNPQAAGDALDMCGFRLERVTDDVLAIKLAADTAKSTADEAAADIESVQANLVPNLTPWFDRPLTDVYNSTTNPNGYWGSATTVSTLTQLPDGWAHFEGTNEQKSGNLLKMRVQASAVDAVVAGGNYTCLIEFRNVVNAAGIHNFYSQEVAGAQIWGNGNKDGFSIENYSVVDGAKIYKSVSSTLGPTKSDTLNWLMSIASYIKPSQTVSYDFRVSLYEGTYTGPYKPYVDQELRADVDAAQTAANNAQTTADRKKQTFISTPTTPYYVGDTYFVNGKLLVCHTERLTGSYTADDWSEDLGYASSDTVATLEASTKTELDTIRSEASANYTSLSDSLDKIQASFNTQVEQTSEDFSIRINGLLESLTSLANDTSTKFAEYSKYFRFTADGLEIGEESNALTLVLDNDKISFRRNGVEFSYWDGSDNSFHVGDIIVDVNQVARFGSFGLIPLEGGDLAWKWMGSST